MRNLKRGWMAWAILGALMVALPAMADSWQLTVGAQSGDKARQALAFLPNEVWIHAGDTVTWNFATDEIHTVTFLRPGQVRLPFAVGCPGSTPSGSLETGASCVNSDIHVSGSTYTVGFPNAGNFKLVCLVHENMTAVIHVLAAGAALPHDQSFYDQEANRERANLLSDALASAHGDDDHDHSGSVVAGAGKILATPGGSQTLSVMRFMEASKTIHVGDTVEWSNTDSITPHTITFGTEPANPIPPSANVSIDADGARHATISSAADSVHSGFIAAAPQERIGLPQAPIGVTHFRVTFTKAGVYSYFCALHDDLGMVGRIIVVP